MKIKSLFGLFLILCVSDLGKAQTILDFTVGNVTSPKLTFEWSSPITNKSKLTEPTKNLSIGVSSKLYKFLYLRSEFGIKSANSFVDITFPADPTNGYTGDIKRYGWYENTRAYVGFMPELRFIKGLFYVNGGVLFCRDLVNGFSNGYQHMVGMNDYTDFSEMGNLTNNSTGFTFNLGLNPTYKNTGLIIGGGFAKLSPVWVHGKGTSKIGVNMAYVSIGISHKIN